MPSFHDMPDEHSRPFYADPSYDFTYGWSADEDDYEPEPEPIYCAGCSDKEVDNEGDVCATCRASEADDWIFPGGYEHMRELAALQDARAAIQSEICAIRAMIPSMRRAQ